MYRLLMNSHRYQIILPVKRFYTNWERCEVLTGYLSLGRRPDRDWVNTWHRAKHFTVSAIYHRSRCPKENQISIPFPVQGRLQCFCTDNCMFSTGFFWWLSLIFCERIVNSFWQKAVEGINKCLLIHVKISRLLTNIYNVINWTTAFPWSKMQFFTL